MQDSLEKYFSYKLDFFYIRSTTYLYKNGDPVQLILYICQRKI